MPDGKTIAAGKAATGVKAKRMSAKLRAAGNAANSISAVAATLRRLLSLDSQHDSLVVSMAYELGLDIIEGRAQMPGETALKVTPGQQAAEPRGCADSSSCYVKSITVSSSQTPEASTRHQRQFRQCIGRFGSLPSWRYRVSKRFGSCTGGYAVASPSTRSTKFCTTGASPLER